MPVTLEGAVKVYSEVVEVFKADLPGGLYGQLTGLDAKKVFVFLAGPDYQKVFTDYYRNFFAGSNAVIFGKGGTTATKWSPPSHALVEDVIAVADRQGPGTWLSTCPAFTSPACDVTRRKIYIKEDPTTNNGTLYHEMVHFLQHANLYPEFYSLGGENPFIMEGVTEYFTRRISSAVCSDRVSQNKYAGQFNKINGWVGVDPSRHKALVEWNFKGVFTPLRLGETTVTSMTNVKSAKVKTI